MRCEKNKVKRRKDKGRGKRQCGFERDKQTVPSSKNNTGSQIERERARRALECEVHNHEQRLD